MLRRILLGIVLTGLLMVLASCNTIRGVGRDISAAGYAISQAASDDTP